MFLGTKNLWQHATSVLASVPFLKEFVLGIRLLFESIRCSNASIFSDLSEELDLLPPELADFGNDGFDNDVDNGDEEEEEDEEEQLKRIFDEYEPGKVHGNKNFKPQR